MNSTERFLSDFHRLYPSCTPEAFLQGATRDGKTPYQLLETLIPSEAANISILDLACGDGTLSQNIWDRFAHKVQIHALDMSPDELAVAQKKPFASWAKFYLSKAQQLPLPSDSLDFTLCHMALMLMKDIEAVIGEVHRCLKIGGLFSAVLSGQYERSPLHEHYQTLIKNKLQEEGKELLGPLGDLQTLNATGLQKIFAESNFTKIRMQDHQILFKEKPQDMVQYFMLLYNTGLLSTQGRKDLHEALLSFMESRTDPQGYIEDFVWLRQVTAVK